MGRTPVPSREGDAGGFSNRGRIQYGKINRGKAASSGQVREAAQRVSERNQSRLAATGSPGPSTRPERPGRRTNPDRQAAAGSGAGGRSRPELRGNRDSPQRTHAKRQRQPLDRRKY